MDVNPTILLVEDDADDRLLTLRALERCHIANQIVTLRDGAEALEFLLPRAAPIQAPPVVVLLDLRLPKIDGLEVLRQIREHERTRLQPVMVLVSEELDRVQVQAQDAELTSCLPKPLKFDDLAQAANELGLSWAMTRPLQVEQDEACG